MCVRLECIRPPRQSPSCAPAYHSGRSEAEICLWVYLSPPVSRRWNMLIRLPTSSPWFLVRTACCCDNFLIWWRFAHRGSRWIECGSGAFGFYSGRLLDWEPSTSEHDHPQFPLQRWRCLVRESHRWAKGRNGANLLNWAALGSLSDRISQKTFCLDCLPLRGLCLWPCRSPWQRKNTW